MDLIDQLRYELTNLQQHLEQQEIEENEFENELSTTTIHDQTTAQLAQLKSAAHQQQLQQLTEQNQQLVQHNQELMTRNNSLVIEMNQIEVEVTARLTHQYDQMRSEWMNELARKDELIEVANKQLDLSEQAIHDLTEDSAVAASQIQILRQLSKMNENSIGQSMMEIQELRLAKEQLEKQLKEVEQQETDASVKTHELLSAANERVSLLERRLLDSEQRNEDDTEAINALKDEHAGALRQMEQQMLALQETTTQLQQQLLELELSKNEEIASLKQTLLTLQSEMAVLLTERDGFDARLSDAKSELDCARTELENKAREHHELNTAYMELQTQSRSTSDASAAFDQTLEKLNSEISHVQNELSARTEQFESERKRLTTELSEANEKELKALQTTNQSLVAEVNELNERLTQMEGENDRLTKLVPTEKTILKLVKTTREQQKKVLEAALNKQQAQAAPTTVTVPSIPPPSEFTSQLAPSTHSLASSAMPTPITHSLVPAPSNTPIVPTPVSVSSASVNAVPSAAAAPRPIQKLLSRTNGAPTIAPVLPVSTSAAAPTAKLQPLLQPKKLTSASVQPTLSTASLKAQPPTFGAKLLSNRIPLQEMDKENTPQNQLFMR